MTKNYTEDSWVPELKNMFADRYTRDVVEVFIRKTIKEHDAGLSKAIEGMLTSSPKCYCKTHPEHNCGITSNETIQDVLALFSPEKE